MSSQNLAEEKENIEHILHDAADMLETNISGIILFYIKNEDDPNRIKVGNFCKELEALKKIIMDKDQKLTMRIHALGKVANAFDEMIDYIDHKAIVLRDESGLLHSLGMLFRRLIHKEEVKKQSIKELLTTYVSLCKSHGDDYFKDCQAALEKIVNERPELKND